MYYAIHALLNHQHGLVTRRQAVDAGVTDLELHQLVRNRHLVRVRRGVLADADAWSAAEPYRERPLLQVRAAHMVVKTGHWFSHDSAALIHGIGLVAAPTAVHLTRPGVLGGRHEWGIHHHRARIGIDQIGTVDGLPVLDLARTAADLARQHGFDQGLAAVDHVLRRGVPRERLAQVADSMKRWPGSLAVGRAVALGDPGAETIAESLGRSVVLELGIGTPETQFGLSDGHRTVFCDLCVGRHVFEVDGKAKYELGGADAVDSWWEEKKRQDFVTGFKLGVSRLTWHDFFDGRAAARQRLLREYADTVRRFGTDVSDLAPYRVRRRLPAA